MVQTSKIHWFGKKVYTCLERERIVVERERKWSNCMSQEIREVYGILPAGPVMWSTKHFWSMGFKHCFFKPVVVVQNPYTPSLFLLLHHF